MHTSSSVDMASSQREGRGSVNKPAGDRLRLGMAPSRREGDSVSAEEAWAVLSSAFLDPQTTFVAIVVAVVVAVRNACLASWNSKIEGDGEAG